jgi:predicted neuraminidase
MFLRSRGGVIYRCLSLGSCGQVWSDPEPTALPNPNSAVELIRLGSGSLLAVFNPSRHYRSPLRVALSDDNGERWPTWRDLETGPGEFSYPTATQTDDGLIHVLYTHRRQTVTHAWFDERWVRGTG